MPPEPSIKQRIRAGDILAGLRVSTTISQESLEALLSQGDYDYLYVDSQHEALNEQQLAAFCAVAEGLGLPVQLRIPHTRHTYLIGRYLDFGPSMIMVPEVETEASIDEAIRYFYYPPLGQRSWGGTARHGLAARQGNLDRLEYAAWWNQTGALAIQIESLEAVINAGKLAKAGVDVVGFGPNDLMFSLEAHPKSPFKTVEACIAHVAEQLAGTNIRLSMAAATPEERQRYLDLGVTLFLPAVR